MAMTRSTLTALVVLAAAAVTLPHTPVHAQSTMKECAAEWQKMKSANQTGGKTYREFSKECMSKSSAAPAAAPAAAAKPAAAPATAAKPAAAPAATASKPAAAPTTSAAKPSDGRQAMYARERACGAEWKADKAAGKTGNQKWPQYWSECNKRKKAAGM